MAIADCVQLPDPPPALTITFPGGATLQSIQQSVAEIELPEVPAANIMAQAGTALAPMKPLFDIIGTIQTLFDCVLAVPKAISQLNPSPILDCIPDLQEKISQLLALVPQISAPLFIVGTLDAVIAFLEGAVGTLEKLLEDTERIALLVEQAEALNDPNLDQFLECAQTDVDTSATNVANSLGSLGALLDSVNIILPLIGQSPIDISGAGDPESLEDLVQLLNSVVDIISNVRNAIPV